MFQPFYSLNTTPFTKELDVKHSFESEAFAEAMGRLEFLKKTRGIGLLTGEPGAGKTFLLRSFASSLPDSLYKVVYFPLSTVTVMDFYRGIASGLGEEPKFTQGWTRLINNLATHCLLYGFQARKDQIDEEIVRLASKEVGF